MMEEIVKLIEKAPPAAALKKHKVVLCDNCHAAQMGNGKKSLKCFRCEKVNKFWIDGHLKNFLLQTDNIHEAVNWTKELEIVVAYVKASKKSEELLRFFKQRKN